MNMWEYNGKNLIYWKSCIDIPQEPQEAYDKA